MIVNLADLIRALNQAWSSKPLAERQETRVRLHFNGFDYEFNNITVREDGSLTLWVEGD